MYINKNNEILEASLLEQLTDEMLDPTDNTIDVIPLETKKSSFLSNLNKILPFKILKDQLDSEEDNQETQRADVIEIEVPVIGSEFGRVAEVELDRYENRLNDSDVEETRDTFLEFDLLTMNPTDEVVLGVEANTFFAESTTEFSETTDEILENSTIENKITELASTERESTTPKWSRFEIVNSFDELMEVENQIIEKFVSLGEDIEHFEKKLSEIDDGVEDLTFKIHPEPDVTTSKAIVNEDNKTIPEMKTTNVKIIVNKPDNKKSCKNFTSCYQVQYSQSKTTEATLLAVKDEADLDESVEDLSSEYVSDKHRNEMRSRNARKAADDDFPTPAPRINPLFRNLNIKKPAFIEKLESETSVERTERVNTGIERLMRFVAVMAQVDSYVSNRARNAFKKLAHIYSNDDDDVLRIRSNKVSEPFT
ncbi:unnamed protein product [Diamesa serratosioi]